MTSRTRRRTDAQKRQQAIRDNFDRNIKRVEALVTSYEWMAAQKEEGQDPRGRHPTERLDVLRAAVVMLHASFEEACRSIAEWKLPHANEEVLNKIPLLGIEGRADSFKLGRLKAHQNLTVSDLIRQSVRNYLQKFSVNNEKEINDFLKDLDINTTTFMPKIDLTTMTTAMKRRHHIVHQADKNDQHGRGHHRAKHLTIDDVKIWTQAVQNFITELLKELTIRPDNLAS